MVERNRLYVRQNIKVLDDDAVARICHENDFSQPLIDNVLRKYLPDEKYKGLEEYEWNTTKTRAEKDQDRRRKLMEQERKRVALQRAKE